jgi:hypothetical protein
MFRENYGARDGRKALLLSPELRLLLCCTRLNPSDSELAETQQMLAAPIRWESVPELACHHGVAALVFRALQEDAAVPEAVRERLCEFAKHTAVANLRLTHELLSLHELCRNQNLALVPYKGPALSTIIYGDPCVRDTSDLDFLIQPRDLARLARLLLARGYAPEQRIPTNPDSDYLARVSECEFSHPETGIRIDVHWNVAPRHLGITMDPTWLWEGTSQVSLNGVTMPAMRTEKLVLSLCIHGTKHAWERLKWICDLGNLLRANPRLDWSEISNAAIETGASRSLALGLWMAHHLVAAPLPQGYGVDASAEALAQHCVEILHDAATGQSSARRRWLFLLQLQSGWRNKARAVKRFLAQPEIGTDRAVSSALGVVSLRRLVRVANAMIRN